MQKSDRNSGHASDNTPNVLYRPLFPQSFTATSSESELENALRHSTGGKDFMSLTELASFLGISTKTVSRRIESGELSAYRTGEEGGTYILCVSDVASYLRTTSTVKQEGSLIEMLLQSLDESDPEDYKFRQELDRFVAARVKEVSEKHGLEVLYAQAFVEAEVLTHLEGSYERNAKAVPSEAVVKK